MLERLLAWLAGCGVDEAVLSLGYRPDAFRRAYPEGRFEGIRLAYAVESEPLDTAGAVRFAALEAGVNERFLVVNGDVLTDLDLGALVAFHMAKRAQATIHLTPVEDPSRFGVVQRDDEGRVLAFIEKPARHEAPTNLINAGSYVLEPEVLASIPAGRPVSIEREVFPALSRDGCLFAMPSDDYWLDMGTPEAYLRAHADLLGGRRPGPPAPGARPGGTGWWTMGDPAAAAAAAEDASLGPATLVGRDVCVGAGATVARSSLGDGVTIEGGAVVDGAVVLAGARVGAGATVTASILGPRACVGAGAAVDDLSVLGDGVEVASGHHVHGERIPADGPGA
jgi:NDP-sugar pyrophosphorylase family protein